MPLTKEQLLIPRYKVIAPWPGMDAEPFRLHEIVTLTWHLEDDGEAWIHRPLRHIPGSYMRQGFFDKYPHLFEPLPWWSDRSAQDMPEYLKINYINGARCCKVNQWLHKIGEQFVFEYTSNEGLGLRETTRGTEPITEEEYTAYINQKQ